MIRSRDAVLAFVIAVLLAGCTDASTNTSDDEPPTLSMPAATTGPYVSVAVDNHFHDIHPANHIEISQARAFVVANQGSNLHNVSIIGTDISHDVRPGKSFVLKPLRKYLELGTYQIFCKYHADRGMVGEITVVP